MVSDEFSTIEVPTELSTINLPVRDNSARNTDTIAVKIIQNMTIIMYVAFRIDIT